MKGYKAFNYDMTCMGYKFEVGKDYKIDGEIEMCVRGFHFCEKLQDVFSYYPVKLGTIVCEIEALGTVLKSDDDSKRCTNHIKIIRILSENEIDGINYSYGINRSYGINGSDGINRSYGISYSYGINRSNGINNSNGINRSYGILNCKGVSNSIFDVDKKETFSLFGKKIKEDRWQAVWCELHFKLNGWQPNFNNMKSLYIKQGNRWANTPVHMTKEQSKKEAWKDMPKEAIDYVRSLPEFNSQMFYKITGLKVRKKTKKVSKK